MSFPSRDAYLKALEPQECAICYEVLNAPIRTACSHLFCRGCAEIWFKSSNTCPSCRNILFSQGEPTKEGEPAQSSGGPLNPAIGDVLEHIMVGFAPAPHIGTSVAAEINERVLFSSCYNWIDVDLASRPAPSVDFNARFVVNYEILAGTTMGVVLWASAGHRRRRFTDPEVRKFYDSLWQDAVRSFCRTIFKLRGREFSGAELSGEMLGDWKEKRGTKKYPVYPEGYQGKSFQEEMFALLDRVIVAGQQG